ncbi:MAG: xylulokinase [Eubacteriales bacterium]|nr:xylulokinase [Eubacteriales bacterium]MDD4324042.1 xylulokinase [Eubacteriales bacterium]MDD4541518.1 xylulokinase [Eubacteriales bacterium]
MEQLLGVDCGTGGCKTTVIDRNGTLLASASQEYPSYFPYPGWSEQNPEDWVQAVVNTIKSCIEQLGSAKDIQSISFSASTHNTLIEDKDGKIIRPCIMWNDQRSYLEADELIEKYEDDIFSIGMQLPTPTWTLPQLLWLKRNEEDNFNRIHKYYCVKDYVRHFFTGDWSTDIVDAQGTLLFDARKMEWSEDLCDIIGLPLSVLPPINQCKDIAGYVSEEASKVTGLTKGIPVVTGCSDTSAEDFGAGAISEGDLIIKLATAANVNVVTNNPMPDKRGFTYPHVVENTWYNVLATNSCASSYRWLRNSVFSEEMESYQSAGKDVYELMDELAAGIPIGSAGMLYHPFLQGERCPYYDSALKASFTGISSEMDKRHFARSVLEGVAYSINDCYSIVKTMEIKTNDARLIGGGAKSSLWSQIVCDVVGIPVYLPENDDSSFGGALLAGIGIGIFSDARDAAEKCIRMKKRLEPDLDNHEKYKKYFGLYKEIVQALTPIYKKLQEIESKE